MKLAKQTIRNGKVISYRITMGYKEAEELDMVAENEEPRDIVRIKLKYGTLIIPVTNVVGTLTAEGITSQICENGGLYCGKFEHDGRYFAWKSQSRAECDQAFKKAVFSCLHSSEQ